MPAPPDGLLPGRTRSATCAGASSRRRLPTCPGGFQEIRGGRRRATTGDGPDPRRARRANGGKHGARSSSCRTTDSSGERTARRSPPSSSSTPPSSGTGTPAMMAAEGPAIVPSRERGKASVFDVAPTLCRLLGLPSDPAFEGKPVAGLGGPALPKAVAPVSWEKAAPSNGSSSADDAAPTEEGCRGVHEEAHLARLPDRLRGGRRGRPSGRPSGHRDDRALPEPRDVPAGAREGTPSRCRSTGRPSRRTRSRPARG